MGALRGLSLRCTHGIPGRSAICHSGMSHNFFSTLALALQRVGLVTGHLCLGHWCPYSEGPVKGLRGQRGAVSSPHQAVPALPCRSGWECPPFTIPPQRERLTELIPSLPDPGRHWYSRSGHHMPPSVSTYRAPTVCQPLIHWYGQSGSHMPPSVGTYWAPAVCQPLIHRYSWSGSHMPPSVSTYWAPAVCQPLIHRYSWSRSHIPLFSALIKHLLCASPWYTDMASQEATCLLLSALIEHLLCASPWYPEMAS